MRVKGKRVRRDESNPSINFKKRGRPLKPPDELAPSRRKINQYFSSRNARLQTSSPTTSKKLSEIECLPVELQQHVFFHSLEVNLLQASRTLRNALSTEAIWNILILFAYFIDDETSPVETKLFLPAQYRHLSLQERVKLQMRVSRSQWFTLTQIQRCLPSLRRLVMVQAWHRECDCEVALAEDLSIPPQDFRIVTPIDLLEYATLPSLADNEQLQKHFFANRTQETPSELYYNCPRIITWKSVLTTEQPERPAIVKHLSGSESCFAAHCIPDWLLRNDSWTTEQIELLQLLRQGFGFVSIDNVMEISAQAVMAGITNAIKGHNTLALRTLLELHATFFEQDQTLQGTRQTELSPPSNHPLQVEIFHLATQQGEKSSELVALLLRASVSSVPLDDSVLTTWAVHEEKQLNPVASWLLRYMREGPKWLESQGFYQRYGRIRNTQELPFPHASTFAEELGYLRGSLHSNGNVPSALSGQVCGA